MIDERERFERAFELFRMPEPSFDRLVQRRDRKRRNQRVAAGVVGVMVFAAMVFAFALAIRSDAGPKPANTPSPA